LSIRLPIQE